MQTTTQPLDENAIRTKAYELWCAKGFPEGTAEQDWYEAMQALSRTRTTSSTPPPPSKAPEESASLKSSARTAETATSKPTPVVPAKAKTSKAPAKR